MGVLQESDVDWVRWAMVVLALLPGVWMTYDGMRALIVGDFFAPRTGPYAGRLGPWRHVVSSLGIEPRGTLMKSAFVVYGVLWLGAAAAGAAGVAWAPQAVLALAVLTLWFLPFGTMVAALELILAGICMLRGSGSAQ